MCVCVRAYVRACVCFFFIPPQTSGYDALNQHGLFESIERVIRKYASLGKASLVGDLKSRCGNRLAVLPLHNVYKVYKCY